MNESLIILVGGFVTAALLIIITSELVNMTLPKKSKEGENNLTIYLVKGAMFLSGAILLNELLSSSQNMVHLISTDVGSQTYIVKLLQYYGLFLGATLVTHMVLIYMAALLFATLSNGSNVFWEVTLNNVQAVILYAAVLLMLAIGASFGLGEFLDSFLPYQTPVIY